MTLGPDLLLDDDTHDLDLSRDGDLTLRADVAQAVRIRLLAVRGEWFLDRDLGVPYFEQIFVKAPNIDHLRAIYRTTIVDTPGIGEVRAFELSLNAQTRELTLTWSADTDEGEISNVETITV